MKNTLLKLITFSLLLFVSIFFTNCEKEQFLSAHDAAIKNSEAGQSLEQRAQIPTRQWFDNGDEDYGCEAVPATCAAEDVIITASKLNAYNKMKLAAQGGANLISTFSSYSSDAYAIFGNVNAAGVINGNTTIQLKGPKSGIVYWKFVDISTGSLVSVIGVNE